VARTPLGNADAIWRLFVTLAAALAATVLLWIGLTETKPGKYLD